MLQLDDNIAQHHILSIRLAPDGFSFFTTDMRDNKVSLFQTIPVNTHHDVTLIALNTMRNNDIFSYPFKAVRLLLDSPDVTVIPEDIYDEDKKEMIFSLNIDLATNERVMVNTSKVFNVAILFSMQKELYAFFTKNFLNFTVTHNVALMLHQASSFEETAQEQLFISYSGQHFSVVGLKNNGFIFHNCFKLNVEDDFIYYFLLVLQDLGYDQYSSSAVITGIIDENVNEINVIRQYLAKLDFGELPHNTTYTDEFLAHPSHYYSNFIALPFCE